MANSDILENQGKYSNNSADKNNPKLLIGNILILLLIILLSLILLSPSNPYYSEPGRDSGFFMFTGRELLHGKELYTQIWDSKGPMIFFVNALGFWLGGGTRWGLWFLELILLVIGFGLAYSVLNKHWGHPAALFGIISGAFAFATIFGNGNTVEEYSLFFALLSLYFYDKGLSTQNHRLSDLIIGASLMASFHFRANNIGIEIIIIILIIINAWKVSGFKSTWPRIGWLFLGTLLVNLPIFLYFYLHGTLNEMFEASILYNFTYSQVYGSNSFLIRIINDSLLPGLVYFKGWSYVFGLGYLGCIYYAIRGWRQNKVDPLVALTLFSFPFEVILSAISGRRLEHYFINWIPTIILSSGILFKFAEEYLLSKDLIQTIKSKAKPYATAFVLILIVAIYWEDIFTQSKVLYKYIKYPEQKMEFVSRTAKYISENTNPDDKVLVIGGQCGINLMSNRSSIDGALFYPLINNSPIGIRLQEEYYKNLKEQRPVLIVDGFALYPWHLPAVDPENRAKQKITSPLSQNTDEVLNYVWENYHLEYEVEGYSIYRINP